MLPEDIEIEKGLLDNVDISINGAGALVDDYFADIDYDPELFMIETLLMMTTILI